MGTQGSGRKRLPNRERLTAEDDALNQIAREAEARLAAKRAARAEAREIRMKELERQQKEIYQVQKKYYGLDTKWGDIEQWMEDSERYSRRSRRNTSASDEDERMSAGSRGSLRVEERPEKDFTEKGSRGLPGLSAATLASLGGTSSRRGSGDTSTSIDTEASIREIKELNELKDQIQDVEGKYMQGLKEMKDSLAEVEEKYKKAMVSNAQLDNEKTNFMYQVDTLKDMMLELEEQLAESRRQYEEKSKEFEREKHAHSVLQFQFAEVKEALKQREEMLEKHGIILNSEIATNGETSDPLNNVGYQGSTKMTQEELNALKATGDGTLGRANEVEVKNEMVEDEGKSEILQNSEQRQHKDDPGKGCVDTEVLHPGDSAEGQETSEDTAPSPGKGCVDTEVLHPGDNAEGQETSEGTAPSPGTLVNSENEVQSQILENTSFFENTQQVESSEVVNSELDGEIPGPRIGQGSSNALDIKNQSKESAEEWEKEKREDFETSLEGMSIEPRQESAPLQTSEVGRESSADTGKRSGNPTEAGPQAGLTGLGEQPGTVASSPPRGIDDTVSHREKRELDAPEGLDPSSGHDLEKELTNQEVAEPKEVPVQSTEGGGESDEEEGKGRKSRDEKPIKLEVQAIPCSPEARSSPQEVTGPSTVDAESEPLDAKEPDEEKNDQQGEALDSSHKKTKNKKKKNKKKRSPAPVETKDVQKELTFQSPDLSEVKEEQVKFTDKKPVVEAQNEVTENPKENPAVGSSKNADGPENPRIELDGGLNRDDFGVNTKTRKAVADGGTLDFEDTTVQSSGASASNKELEEGAMKDGAEEDGTAPSRPPGPDDEEVPGSAPLQDEDPAKNLNDGCQAEGTEEHVTSENLGQTVRKASDSISLENEDVGPAGEVGDCNSEGKEETTGEHGKGRNKEDCTLS
ncbi:leucine-rich repeat flightless-interacting protein 1 isoform X24 [Physeter macrocephalus]|uniref:Leucine-rich repeat flightless-interacting protein 1 isoform X24 n=1 Tax=Physeter macrocephalus TaxID=9755 RepID=A0A455AQ42_PHYMC|nr:leucine-rich repeat flightless-interacting protein 1 isoform X24 [Physeter catodon]|eukprot:XP_028338775.1 leucine-rich repeat flightless-interacting protein 1 isoform X25 [Physeter catodon]